LKRRRLKHLLLNLKKDKAQSDKELQTDFDKMMSFQTDPAPATVQPNTPVSTPTTGPVSSAVNSTVTQASPAVQNVAASATPQSTAQEDQKKDLSRMSVMDLIDAKTNEALKHDQQEQAKFNN